MLIYHLSLQARGSLPALTSWQTMLINKKPGEGSE